VPVLVSVQVRVLVAVLAAVPALERLAAAVRRRLLTSWLDAWTLANVANQPPPSASPTGMLFAYSQTL
jgi:hypothetical protein